MTVRSLPVFFTVLLLAPPAYAESPVFTTSNGAIRGYDPVAYFSQAKPVKGSKQYALEWNGASWHFASAENRDRFRADPKKFAPQYGGYCSYAVANGYTASTDPQAWSIVNGKLYLNYSLGVRERWRQDIPGYISQANNNWPGVLK
ncbi:MAG: YHS domain-containing (seleno)protein [Acidiferrobacterales bacterium]